MIANIRNRLRKLVLGIAQKPDQAGARRGSSAEEEAEACFRAAWARHVADDVDGAIARYRDVLRLDPAHARARENLGVLLLARGDFSPFSWECYGAHLIDQLERLAAAACPPWDGSDLRGRSIVVHGHQGLGDQIMFASCVPDLVSAGARVSLICDARLVALFRTSFPQVDVERMDPATGVTSGRSADVQCALGRLARFFRDAPQKFPARAGYLRANSARIAHWRQELASLGPGLKVGISWRGGDPQRGGRFRSIPLADWADLLRDPGVHWVSLQYGDCQAEIDACANATGVAIRQWPEAIDDLAETAALVSALDLVVSVTTSVAHLAGALDRPLFVLVPARAQWRWLLEGERMPWHPSVRMLRQRQEGDWKAVLDAARLEVQAMAGRAA